MGRNETLFTQLTTSEVFSFAFQAGNYIESSMFLYAFVHQSGIKLG